ncbi:5-formyltetrahydrofolate cyclo-ligase [Candidatus Peregrinibacteria bacterium]|nr:5-formyltetrahydrofolate cyclo-ligase [Candidatus Peregrinibacteria bacterium]
MSLVQISALSKNDLRKEVLQKRAALPKDARQKFSQEICASLQKLIHHKFPDAANILFYVPYKSEVNIKALIKWALLHESYHVYLPKIIDPESALFEAIRISSYDEISPVSENYNLSEPKGSSSISPQMLDLVIVPAVAIDFLGNRIGYGKGYYDRFLANVSGRCQKWAVIFSCQKVEKVPVDEYDIPVDAYVDENGLRGIRNKE